MDIKPPPRPTPRTVPPAPAPPARPQPIRAPQSDLIRPSTMTPPSQQPAPGALLPAANQTAYPAPVEQPFRQLDQPNNPPEETSQSGQFGSVPVGVIIIAVFSILNGIAFFLVPSEVSSGLAGLVLVVTILLAFGLFTLKNIARITFVALLAITLLSSVFGLFQIYSAQNKASQLKAAYTQQLEELRSKPLSAEQSRAVADMNLKIKEKESLTNTAVARAYMVLFVRIIYSGVVIFYLLRPAIKEQFE